MQADDIRLREHLIHIVNEGDVQPIDAVHMAVPYQCLHAETIGDAGDGPADAAESDQTELLAVQPDAVDAAPVAATHLRVKPADLSGELHDQGECVLGHGMVAVMHDVAHADATLARDGKIDVAGDAGAAERKARDMAPNGHRVQYVIGDVEADDDDGFGILGAFEDGVGVQREIAVHADAGDIVQQGEVGGERLDH